MSDVSLKIIFASFKEEDAANEALKSLKEAEEIKLANINNAAVIKKDADGKLHIIETADMEGGKSAGIGALVGGAIGLIGGPAGIAIGAAMGALLGGATAYRDAGFSDENLQQLGEALQPRTSTIVAVIEERWASVVERELTKKGADIMTASLSDDITDQIMHASESVNDVSLEVLPGNRTTRYSKPRTRQKNSKQGKDKTKPDKYKEEQKKDKKKRS